MFKRRIYFAPEEIIEGEDQVFLPDDSGILLADFVEGSGDTWIIDGIFLPNGNHKSYYATIDIQTKENFDKENVTAKEIINSSWKRWKLNLLRNTSSSSKQPKDEAVTFRINSLDYKKFKEYCDAIGVSPSAMIRVLIKKWIKEQEDSTVWNYDCFNL